VGAAMAIQENGTNAVDYFAMLRGWTHIGGRSAFFKKHRTLDTETLTGERQRDGAEG